MDKTEGESGHPNNNFCFTPEDFIKTRNNINDSTRYQGMYVLSWKTINELVGHEETCTNRKDGNVVWKLVHSYSVVQDDFKEVREREV